MVFAVHEEVLEKLLEQRHSEHCVIQIRAAAQGLLKVPQERERIRSVTLPRELKDALQLNDESAEVKAVQIGVQTGVAQVLVDVVVGEFLLRGEATPRQLRFLVVELGLALFECPVRHLSCPCHLDVLHLIADVRVFQGRRLFFLSITALLFELVSPLVPIHPVSHKISF